MRKIGIDPENNETLVTLTDDEYRALCELGIAWGEREIPIWTLDMGCPPDAARLAPALRAVKAWVAAKFRAADVSRLADDLHKALGDEVKKESELELVTAKIVGVTNLGNGIWQLKVESEVEYGKRIGRARVSRDTLELIEQALGASSVLDLLHKRLPVATESLASIAWEAPQ